jgi:hypothetical protein
LGRSSTRCASPLASSAASTITATQAAIAAAASAVPAMSDEGIRVGTARGGGVDRERR